MSIFDGVTADSLFSFNLNRQANLENLSSQALSNGIDQYMKKNYKGAIKEFQRSIGLTPHSSFSEKAFEFMAESHLKLNDKESAKQTYRAALQINQNSDSFHIKLGNLHFADNEYEEAEKHYKEAVRITPDTTNLYSLGQLFLNTNRLTEAENIFSKVDRLDPKSPNGHYALGQTYTKMKNYDAAIQHFNEALKIKKDFHDAKAEIGYIYADMGKMNEADKVVDELKSEAPELSDLLSRYMYKADPPKMLFAWASSSFPFTMGIKTKLSILDDYLANQGASKTFTMEIQFDKEMDRESVEKLSNWEISRASGSGPGEAYNFGLPIPSTEVRISPMPRSVYYDEKALKAVVRFTIQQNQSGDGTIDPSHISFKFKGNDIYGNSINPDYDEFNGFSKTA